MYGMDTKNMICPENDESGLLRVCKEQKQNNDILKRENDDLVKQIENLEKLLRDKDRISRQDKSQISYFEQENRRLKAREKDLQEMLTEAENKILNLEKDKEQQQVEFKSIQRKFENER